MAGWKDTNITNPGTSIKYGADDEEMIMRMFNGVTTGINPVEIKSTNKWGFWDNIMYVRNQADTFNTTIRGAATLTNNWTLAMPSQTANDTLPAIGVANIWSVKQQFDAGMLLKQQSAPSNPASTFNHFYAGTNGHLIRRDSTGAEFDYDVAQNGLPAGLNEEIQINNGGVFGSDPELWWDISSSELHTSGLVVSEDLLLTGDITPPQITTDQNNYSPSGWNNNTTLRLSSDTARNITGIGSQGEGTILFIHNIGSFNITLKDESTSSTDINRFAFPSDVIIAPDNTATIKYDGVTNRWRLISASTTSSGFAQLAISNIFTDSQTVQDDASSDVLYLYRATNVVDSFIDLNFDFNDSLGNRDTYVDIRPRLKVNTSGSETAEMDINTIIAGTKAPRLRIRNDGNFQCGPNLRINFLETGLGSTNDYTFPDVDTQLAGIGAINVFTEEQQIKDTSALLLKLYRNSAGTGLGAEIWFDHNNTTPTQINSGNLRYELTDNTAGSEDCTASIGVRRSGTLNKVLQINEWGELEIGPDEGNFGRVTRNVIRSAAAQNFVNTSAEQTLFSQNILGGTMGTAGVLHLRLFGSLKQSTTTSNTYTLRIKWGGTTVYQDDILSAYTTSSANYMGYILDLYVMNANATNAQLTMGTWMMNDATGTATTGYGDASDDEQANNAVLIGTSQTKDTTANQTLAVTMQMSAANTSSEVNIDYKWLEINPS